MESDVDQKQLFPAGIVTTAQHELAGRIKAAYADFAGTEKRTLTVALDIGQMLNELCEAADNVLDLYVTLGIKQQRASEFRRIARLPKSELAKCESLRDAIELLPSTGSGTPQGSSTLGVTKSTSGRSARVGQSKAKSHPLLDDSGDRVQGGDAEAEDADQDGNPLLKRAEALRAAISKIEALIPGYDNGWTLRKHVKTLAADLLVAYEEISKAPPAPPSKVEKCRDCGAPVQWYTTENRARMLVDAERVLGGHYDFDAVRGVLVSVAKTRLFSEKLFRAHFLSCPKKAS